MTAITCRLCGAPLHRVADLAADEWAWAGPDGRRTGPDSDLPPDPSSRLAGLAAAMEAAGKISPKRAALTHVYWAAAREYSGLMVRLDFGGTWHEHYPAAGTVPGYAGLVPECCGWPGWLRPSGWQCRQCGAALAVASAA